jgi:uncharacterized membrane protein
VSVSVPGRGWTDERVEVLIGKLLRSGVLLSAGIVLAAGIWYLVRFGAATPDYRVFRGEPSEFRSISGILKGLGPLHCRSYIQFGLLLLIATPVARVAFSVFAFLAERDRTYVVVSLIVLGVLIYSLSGGMGHG